MTRKPSRPFVPLAALVLAACQSAQPAAPSAASPVPPATMSPQASAESSIGPYAGASAVIPMGDGPRGVAWADGSIWVASTIGDVVQRVDPTTNAVTAEVPAGMRPVTLVTVDGDLWASVLNGDAPADDEVVRIDAATNDVDLRVSVPVHHNIAVGGGAIWVQDLSGNLRRIDPASGRVTDAAATGLSPVALAANDAAVFGIRGSGTVWRHPIGGGDLTEAALDVNVPGRSRVVASDAGLWIAVPGTVLAMDPASLQVLTTLAVPEMSLVNDLYATGSDVWLSANLQRPDLGLDGGSVLRLDPGTLEIRGAFRLGPESSGLIVAEGSLWAVDQTDDQLARFDLGNSGVD